MGYIKKLKNNELVGGTDKTTIYPVTSTEAVFEETTNGSESSFKSQKTINKKQQDELDDHEERIQAAEAEDIKSITINGSTKKFRVDDNNNVDLTIYTVDSDPEMPSIASNVEDLRNMVGTSTPVLETSHKTRIETLEGGESVTGSVENKIKTKVDSINSSYQDDDNEYVKYSMTQASGEVTDFNIDETNLKNAITSLNSSISGDNIVIRSGSTPSGTGEPGKIYRYINSSANTYTDYMYSDGSWVSLATHDTSNEQAQVAYYTCIATGSGAQATKQFVSSGSLTYTPSSGGHIKILMGEANTATGTIYLKFGTTSATDSTKKPLYYNGEPASASNTWEEGEVISVYYDGQYYQASNAQGGGNVSIITEIDAIAEYTDKDVAGATALQSEIAYGNKLSTSYGADGMTSGVILRVEGKTSGNNSYMTSDYIELPHGVSYLKTSNLASNNAGVYIGLVLYNSSQTKLTTVCDNGQPIPEIIDIKNDYPTAKYIRYCSSTSASPVVEVYVPRTLKEAMDEFSSEISKLDDELQYGDKFSTSYSADGMTSGVILGVDGKTSSRSGYMTSGYIELPANTTSLHTSRLIPNNANTYIGLVLYNNSQSKLATVCESGQSIPEIIDVQNDYPTAKYIRYCSYTSSSPVVDIYVVGTLKNAVDKLSGIKSLSKLINVSERFYGNHSILGREYGYGSWFTQKNAASDSNGILESIWFYAPTAGTYEFAVGLLDQRNTLVNERRFEITFDVAGVNIVDVYDQFINIKKGEQVFAYHPSIRAYITGSPSETTSLYASEITGEFGEGWKGSTSGFGWTVLSIEAPFALKNDVNELENRIDELENQTSNIGYVVSQNGDRYRIGVSNGEIVLLSTQYKKVIALGNSLTNHGPNESIGWYGGAWAMAATRENTGWTQQFQRILRQKEANAIVTGVSVYSWERNPATNISDMLDPYLTNDVDCIIFRAGENAHPSDSNTWSEQIKTLLNYCLTRCPNASIILSTCMWADATKNAAIAKVATDWGLPLIYPGTSNDKERMGDYVEGTDLQLHKITDSGVAKHVNDIGFLRFANRLAANIGYATLDEQHNVTVVDGSSIGYTCFSSWVANGIFNIKTTATTVTAVDANNNALTVTNHGDEFFTFVMPDTDVTITIS